MADGSVTRKLAAILYADVVGYSRLTGTDELGTHQRLSEALDFIASAVKAGDGRIVHYAGDAVLADFASVVAALECAVVVQRELAERSPSATALKFRIGLNLGEVIVDRDDIYGDGVNVAARLESLADAGGICLSAAVFEQVKGKVDVAFEAMGPQNLKNIAEPVQTYRVVVERSGVLAAVPPDSHPDERSIAVLAFTNLSGDSEQEYFSDGVSEDIITSLSKISGLFVIARNSSFAYKGNAVDIKEVSRALGVRHVLEGSVRKAGNRVRVTAQLIDGTTGGHVWAEKYDRDLDDIFAVQDDVTQQIVAALKIHLTPEERTRIDLGETTNTEAYDHVLRARDSYLRTTRDSLTDAAEQLHRAIDLDPNYARARSQLAQVYLTARYHGWSDDPDRALVDAYELASEAVRLGPDLPHAHSILGSALLWRGEIDIALTEAETALALDPNDADGYEGLAEIKLRLARYEEALELFDKAVRLNPNFPFFYLSAQGLCLLMMERFAEAASAFERGIRRHPDFAPHYIFLASCYGHLGKREEAAGAIDRAASHGSTIDQIVKFLPSWDANAALILEGLRLAGVDVAGLETGRGPG